MKQFVRFIFAGGIGFITDSLGFTLFQYVINLHIARILSFLIAVVVTFMINRHFTFNNRLASFSHYFYGQFKGFLLNFLVFGAAIDLLGDAYVVLAFLAGSGAALFFNFFYAKFLVFKS